MTCKLIIVRYPEYLGWAGLLSMAIFRFPLWFQRKISFWKLMGCGKNGTFDKQPDWRQWAMLTIHHQNEDDLQTLPQFISRYWAFFKCEVCTFFLEPIEGHGTWDGRKCFGNIPKQSAYEGHIAVLTRATIRLNRLNNFWKHVDAVANQMSTSKGFITSIGIGEVPWIKQATFSIWESKEAMKAFAYQLQEHKEVIRKTHQEKWYSEEMFVRFRLINCEGTINNMHPLERKP